MFTASAITAIQLGKQLGRKRRVGRRFGIGKISVAIRQDHPIRNELEGSRIGGNFCINHHGIFNFLANVTNVEEKGLELRKGKQYGNSRRGKMGFVLVSKTKSKKRLQFQYYCYLWWNFLSIFVEENK